MPALERNTPSKVELIESDAAACGPPVEVTGDDLDDDQVVTEPKGDSEHVATETQPEEPVEATVLDAAAVEEAEPPIADAVPPAAQDGTSTALSRIASGIEDPHVRDGLRETKTDDRSNPIIEPGTVIGKSGRPKLIESIKLFEAASLSTPSNVSDRGAPKIENDVTLKASPRQALNAEVKKIGGASSTAAKFEAIAKASKEETAPLRPTWVKSGGHGNFRKSMKPRGGPPPKMKISDLP